MLDKVGLKQLLLPRLHEILRESGHVAARQYDIRQSFFNFSAAQKEPFIQTCWYCSHLDVKTSSTPVGGLKH